MDKILNAYSVAKKLSDKYSFMDDETNEDFAQLLRCLDETKQQLEIKYNELWKMFCEKLDKE